ncbi:unnamed protein product [Euphydryas editha]|uniref:Uncharacterized protein n=1 Tax=Euphydryas editha TaxID=104508 RepID=A0AAU9THX7_EUPED|nr:unnamed protein product [Euphydryas editha]
MFWSGNYIAVRELKFLLKEENVTLTQVLEADDILQECQADNKALIQFLTRPDILAELITHVTEEPSKNVELALQYRYANTASEVMASNISTLRDRLSTDVVQMNRLCDFVATDTTLNPLLSSFYSKTIDMLLQRNPKQDGYLHHIVSLRVLDFFKSRRDFLPNLLRNISTSAICDIFKMFLALKDPFNKIIIEWFDEHQFLESLIQIICGTYGDPPPKPATITTSDPSSAPDPSSESGPSSDSGPSSASVASSELAENVEKGGADDVAKKQEEADAARKEERGSLVYSRLPTLVERYPFFIRESGAPRDRSRMPVTPRRGRSTYNTSAVRAERQWRRRFAARNAAALLCDVAADACCGDGAACGCGARALRARLRAEDAVRRLLQAVFTAPPAARRPALEHACDVLLALLRDEPSSPRRPPRAAPPSSTRATCCWRCCATSECPAVCQLPCTACCRPSSPRRPPRAAPPSSTRATCCWRCCATSECPAVCQLPCAACCRPSSPRRPPRAAPPSSTRATCCWRCCATSECPAVCQLPCAACCRPSSPRRPPRAAPPSSTRATCCWRCCATSECPAVCQLPCAACCRPSSPRRPPRAAPPSSTRATCCWRCCATSECPAVCQLPCAACCRPSSPRRPPRAAPPSSTRATCCWRCCATSECPAVCQLPCAACCRPSSPRRPPRAAPPSSTRATCCWRCCATSECPAARRGGRCGRCGRRGGEEGAEELERAVAPHLPLLHHALLRADEPAAVDFGCDLPRPWRAVGTERLAAAALLARLARSAADDVPNALVTLGTPGVLIDMFFEYPNNNFLHKSVCALVRNACANPRFGDRYTAYLIGECNLLERFMKAFEENENLKPHQTRAGYMGHLIEALRNFDQNPPLLDSDMQLRWDTFRETRLRAVLAEHDTPLGGVYPSENTYEFLAKADAAADPEVAVEEEANGHLSVSFARLLHECRSRFARMSDDGQASVDRVSHECRQRVTQGSPECRSRVARMSGHGRTSVARVLPECRAMVA